jgi:arabinofuranosyltransferase
MTSRPTLPGAQESANRTNRQQRRFPLTRPTRPTPLTHPTRLTWATTDRILVAIPPSIWLIFAWHRRWITDDGLIAARTVREILAGNGPVFNPGERVEANTSALWTWLIAGLGWISRADVYTVMMYTGLFLAPLGLLFALLGARNLHKRNAPGRRLVPLGALVVAALPPFWDFATSGLEEPLIFCWLGLCWWLLCDITPETTGRRAYATAFVLGLGWLVRPDMALGTLCFLVGFWFALRPTPRRAVTLSATAAALPLAYELFRMGYYGLLVPNTALVKEASAIHFGTGLAYFRNYEAPYYLWVPALLLLAAVSAAVGWRRFDRRGTAVVTTVAASALLMTLYVVAIGGDFMHARMLLPGTFLLLCPICAVPLPPRTTLRRLAPTSAATAGVLVWAVLCATFMRLPQTPDYIPSSGITDERAFWSGRVGVANPVNGASYVRAILGNDSDPRSIAWLLLNVGTPSHPVLLLSNPATHTEMQLPLIQPGQAGQPNQPGWPVGIEGDILGTLGAQTPLNGLVVDIHGLSYALGSHLEPRPGGRIGHDKTADPVWIVAEYTTADTVPGIDPMTIAAARKALDCGDLRTLHQATTAPLSWNRFWTNVADSLSLTRLRVPNNPLQAESALCAT